MVRMKRSFEKAKKAVERLFWDTCFVETFSEETAAWGESLHEKGEGVRCGFGGKTARSGATLRQARAVFF